MLVSSLDAQQGAAQVLLIDMETFASGAANKGIGQNHAAWGLHRAYFDDIFACADSSSGGGWVYNVPVRPPK
jgi:hypothetical protein